MSVCVRGWLSFNLVCASVAKPIKLISPLAGYSDWLVESCAFGLLACEQGACQNSIFINFGRVQQAGWLTNYWNKIRYCCLSGQHSLADIRRRRQIFSNKKIKNKKRITFRCEMNYPIQNQSIKWQNIRISITWPPQGKRILSTKKTAGQAKSSNFYGILRYFTLFDSILQKFKYPQTHTEVQELL